MFLAVIITYKEQEEFKGNEYSGDLNSELVWYLNGPKQFASWMVWYSRHGLNNELIVRYSDHRVFDWSFARLMAWIANF